MELPSEFPLGAQTLSCSVSKGWWRMDYNLRTAFYVAVSTGAKTNYTLVPDWFSNTDESTHYIQTAKLS